MVLSDALVLQRSPRWVIDDAQRARQKQVQADLAQVLAQPEVRLLFADGAKAEVAPQPRGWIRLPVLSALLTILALVLYMTGVAVLLTYGSACTLRGISTDAYMFIRHGTSGAVVTGTS